MKIRSSLNFARGSIIMLCLFCSQNVMSETHVTVKDIMSLPVTLNKQRIYYGSDECQFADLRLPKTSAPHPVLVIIHGGCWTSKIATLDLMAAFAEEFTKEGFATWNIEYRCIDNSGGGWPGTFLDVGNAIDYLKTIASNNNLDLNNIVVIGHSSGGHLALWSSARNKLSGNSILITKDPLPIKAVVNLSGPGDLSAFMPLQKLACGNDVINKLLGSTLTSKIEKRLAQASPYELLPFGVKQVHITGDHDQAMPPEMMEKYVMKAKDVGDDVEFISIKNASHFDVIAPKTEAFNIIRNKVRILTTK